MEPRRSAGEDGVGGRLDVLVKLSFNGAPAFCRGRVTGQTKALYLTI